MSSEQFVKDFEQLTLNKPFPWQVALYLRFMMNDGNSIPESCNLPTGLGKTSVLAVWLVALAHGAKVPRRLVYVVNRRTVVDQTTDEADKLKVNAPKIGVKDLAVSTLRGQFADNREWCANPSRPAIVCGTVDMIGSRLLFSGYGIGWKSRPLHAGFLGQDVLLVHDEAHLEPAFQMLLGAIRDEQKRSSEFGTFHVMELTATSRGSRESFSLTEADRENDIVVARIRATKTIYLEALKDGEKLADRLAHKALRFKDRNCAVLVFARTVEDVLAIKHRLPKGRVETLTGTMRGKERDKLVKESPLFRRFLPGGQSDDETTYLVCTSAGEVGVNISADHLVCDLSTFESMAQRLGRVNRFGQHKDTEIHIIHPASFIKKDDFDQRREKTLALLKELNGNGSPDALGQLDPIRCREAFAPTPTILPVSDSLFDAWSLTSIKGTLPGRPPVEPYLHGLPTEWQPQETCVAWREEVGEITDDLLEKYEPAMLLDEYPLKPHELLREPSYRAFKHLEAMAKRLLNREVPVWLVHDNGSVQVLKLAELADKDNKALINGKTVLFPPSAGGLEGGMLDGAATTANDVSDTNERRRVWNDEPDPAGLRRILTIEFPDPNDEDDAESDSWRWFEIASEGGKSAQKPVSWETHVGDVERETARIVDALPLSDALKHAVKFAAKYHDHGKRRKLFQRVLGNVDPNVWLAKSGKKGGGIEEKYRHEFGSLLDIENELDSLQLGEYRDFVLHLIATHHGRARPHFPLDEVFDPERSQADVARVALEVPQRFARLQRKYGRWGLAYLESLLRAGDWAASRSPSAFWEVSE